MAGTTAFIILESINEQFPGVLMLDNVNLTLRKGEVHRLADQSGCDKSTIVKVISGAYHPEKGARILLDGKLFHHLTPQLPSYYGIQVICQGLLLFPNFSIAENIAASRYLPGDDIWIRRGIMEQQALTAMKRIGVNTDPDKKAEKLPIADRQLVTICRAIAADTRSVIMNRPVVSLTRQEVNDLLRVTNELEAVGICVVFVSHRLGEVMEVVNCISIIRDGKLVGTYPVSELDSHKLIFLMIGQRLHYSPLSEGPATEQEPLFELRNLSRRDKYQGINLPLHGSEIVPIVGLLSVGRTELYLSLFGITHPENGKVCVDGRPVTLRNNHDAIQHGTGYVSKDRLTQGLIMKQSIYNNIIITVSD